MMYKIANLSNVMEVTSYHIFPFSCPKKNSNYYNLSWVIQDSVKLMRKEMLNIVVLLPMLSLSKDKLEEFEVACQTIA